ncbi:MAG: chromate transporter [Candidatus Caldatribacteriaceae bacterium]
MVGNLLILFFVLLRIGAVMFSGHYAMIPILRHEVIARYGWISEGEFLNLWAISESTPGPTALNAATYVGYKVQGFFGAVVATLGVVIAPFLVMLVIAVGVREYYDHPIVKSILYGLRGAVIALVTSALLSITTGAYKGLNTWQAGIMSAIATVAFLLVFFSNRIPCLLWECRLLLVLWWDFLVSGNDC